MPVGHKSRALLDNLRRIPVFLADYTAEYRLVSLHRSIGFSAPDPLLQTLDIYDRKMGIDREPFETEIMITLDLLERGHWAKSRETTEHKNRGNRR